jgi:two-component system CheB/CheR fusion protein
MPIPDAPSPTESRFTSTTFPVVGLGASVGGVEALQQFFAGLAQQCGMAFVVVQHMDPRHGGNLVEILQRVTTMPVQQAHNKLAVAPDHVYVIAPDRDLSILNGVLVPLERSNGDSRLPIDFFLRSLAADLRDLSVGVILSGMGSDGTMGLRAIKEVAGSIFVQDPQSAQFDSMPRSAIATGLADVVAPASTLAAKVVAYCNFRAQHGGEPAPAQQESAQADLDRIIVLLRAQTGQDFSLYKKSTLSRRIERRMALHQLQGMADYQRYLRHNQHEANLLFKDLLIGVTRFFRDPEVWEQLKTEGISALLNANPNGTMLRAWTPACSTGEEAYSLAMIFQEAVEALDSGVHYTLQIFATDLDTDSIETARAGLYPANIAADVSETRLARYFLPQGGAYRICPEIRDMVVFAQQNLVMDPPFTKLDLLSCRNLLIYLESELQRTLLPLFHYCLKPHGMLVLGSAESIGDAGALFSELDGKSRLFRRRDVAASSDPIEFPPVFSRARKGVAPMVSSDNAALPRVPDLQLLTNELLLQRFAPAALLTTDRGEIVYICGKAGRYLEPAAGKASMNLFAMAREGLSGTLSEVFAKAVREQITMLLRAVNIVTSEGTQTTDVTVQPLCKPHALSGMVLIVFNNATATLTPEAQASGRSPEVLIDARVAAMAQEIQQTRDALKTSREEMQTSQEELKSTNEELQSTNEELQSSNEELTTSKEEMQSVNEELQSVNRELSTKMQEMTMASDEESNLLNSTAIAALFLDAHMRVRRFTEPVTAIFKLIPGDVGRPITDLVTSLDSPALEQTAREVLRTLVFHEDWISAQGKRWFSVRTMPYRTRDNRIDGVVITFADITPKKRLEAGLRRALALLQDTEARPQSTLAGVRATLEQTLATESTD